MGKKKKFLFINMFKYCEKINTSTPTKYHVKRFLVLAVRKTPEELRIRRQKNIRKKLKGTNDRPRLVVHRTNNHMYVQVVDDIKMHTMAAIGTTSPSLKGQINNNNISAANIVGKAIAQLCLKKGIQMVVFDRAGYLYHGRIKALAEAAREAGLIF